MLILCFCMYIPLTIFFNFPLYLQSVPIHSANVGECSLVLFYT
jgi:hypothetical protein